MGPIRVNKLFNLNQSLIKVALLIFKFYRMLASMLPGMTEEQIVHKIAADQQQQAMEMQQVKQAMDAINAGAKGGGKGDDWHQGKGAWHKGGKGEWFWMKIVSQV